MFDKNGWTFVGILGHDTDDKTFRVMYEDDKSRDHAIVSSPVIGMNPEQPPLFTIFLIAAALLGVTFFVSWKSVAIDKEETKKS